MAEADLYINDASTSWGHGRTYGPNYNDVWTAEEANQWWGYSDSPSVYIRWACSPSFPPDIYGVWRAIIDVDLSSLGTPLYVKEAKIVCPDSSGGNNDHGSSCYIVLVDGTDVSRNKSVHGDLFDRGIYLGILELPTTGISGSVDILLNQAGREFLESKAGGIASFGLRLDTDISGEIPGPSYEWVGFHTRIRSGSNAYLHLVYSSTVKYDTYYIWVEGTKFAYLDAYRQKRLEEGTLTGDPDGDPYQAWVYGNYQYYTDYLGKVRRILGTTTGLTGKAPYQVSINTKSPMYGTHYCYIDSSGNEWSFEGSIP